MTKQTGNLPPFVSDTAIKVRARNLAPEIFSALKALLDEAEDVFVCMADATGIDRHKLPPPFVAAQKIIAKVEGRT